MRKPKYYQTKEFKKLQAKWYNKLEKEGFKDIEHSKYQDTPFLKRHSMQCVSVYERGELQGGAFYYRMASGWVWHGEFDSEWDRWVWAKHSEGYSEREIERALKLPESPFEPCSRFPINSAINRVKQQMFGSAWFHNYEYDGYLSPYDTNTVIYGELNDE